MSDSLDAKREEDLRRDAKHLLELEASKLLNRAGYGYVGDLLDRLLRRILDDQERQKEK